MLLSTAFMLLFLYLKNNYYLQEQEQKDKIQIAQLQQQFAYYQEKLKDEEKDTLCLPRYEKITYLSCSDRSILLKQQKWLKKIQSQVAVYEDYEHTGNDILDIILKEKSEKAKGKAYLLIRYC